MQGIFANTEDKKYGIVPQRVFLITGLIHTELLLAQVVSPALDPRSAHHQTFLGCPSVPSDCCAPWLTSQDLSLKVCVQVESGTERCGVTHCCVSWDMTGICPYAHLHAEPKTL